MRLGFITQDLSPLPTDLSPWIYHQRTCVLDLSPRIYHRPTSSAFSFWILTPTVSWIYHPGFITRGHASWIHHLGFITILLIIKVKPYLVQGLSKRKIDQKWKNMGMGRKLWVWDSEIPASLLAHSQRLVFPHPWIVSLSLPAESHIAFGYLKQIAKKNTGAYRLWPFIVDPLKSLFFSLFFTFLSKITKGIFNRKIIMKILHFSFSLGKKGVYIN